MFEAHISVDRALISPEKLFYYCNTNEAIIPQDVKVRGLILEFPGLGGNSCLGGNMDALATYDSPFTRRCAREGLVYAYLFPGPWSWMNRGAVRLIDLVVDALAEKYGLSEGAYSLCVTGGSMGGHGSLMYAIDSRHKVSACAAHCPGYDAELSFESIHPTFPRTFINAIYDYDMPLADALRMISPAHRMEELPKIPYLITADEHDDCFPCEGVEGFVRDMRDRGHDVRYLFLAGMPHGGISPTDRAELEEFLLHHSK